MIKAVFCSVGQNQMTAFIEANAKLYCYSNAVEIDGLSCSEPYKIMIQFKNKEDIDRFRERWYSKMMEQCRITAKRGRKTTVFRGKERKKDVVGDKVVSLDIPHKFEWYKLDKIEQPYKKFVFKEAILV